MKVIMIAKRFMKGHPREGEPTFFETNILNGKKKHTIRAGNRIEKGEIVSLRTWLSKPYRSKQREFAQVLVSRVWPITIKPNTEPYSEQNFSIHIGDRYVAYWKPGTTANITQTELAKNDGLSKKDFLSWFGLDKKVIKPFVGQIICWDEKVNY
jgi:hypothetical protein